MAELKLLKFSDTLFQFDVTHGITAVAELKLDVQMAGCHFRLVTHGITAVAELKRAEQADRHCEQLVTHGITAVAELKREPTWEVVQKLAESPTASQPWPN